MQLKEYLALSLFEIGAIKFGAFKLKLHDKNPEAPLSPIYIDLRMTRSDPPSFQLAVGVIHEIITKKRLKFDKVADIPTASTPFVSALAFDNGFSMISPKISKAHGLTGEIDGIYQPGQTSLLVDDLITQADSKIEAISVLKKNDLVVKDIIVIVDREQGGQKVLNNAGYNLHSVWPLENLLKFYLKENKIKQAKYDEVVAYLEANEN